MNKQLFVTLTKEAHAMTKVFINKYVGLDYKAQYSLCFKYLYLKHKEANKKSYTLTNDTRFKDIIKRGVIDTKWIDDFCISSLQEKSAINRVCTDKMYFALTKYTRSLNCCVDRFSDKYNEFYYNNNSGYALQIKVISNKRYVVIYDIHKVLMEKIENKMNYLKNNRHYKEEMQIEEIEKIHRDLLHIEFYNNFNIFECNLETNKTNSKVINETVDNAMVLSELDRMCEKYGIDA